MLSEAFVGIEINRKELYLLGNPRETGGICDLLTIYGLFFYEDAKH